MSEENWQEDSWQEDAWQGEAPWQEDEEGCAYGFEFCDDPETRGLGLCTTECKTYLDSLKEEDNGRASTSSIPTSTDDKRR